MKNTPHADAMLPPRIRAANQLEVTTPFLECAAIFGDKILFITEPNLDADRLIPRAKASSLPPPNHVARILKLETDKLESPRPNKALPMNIISHDLPLKPTVNII